MGPSLAIASGLEGRLRPGVLNFKGDPPPGGRIQETAGMSPSAPWPSSDCLSLVLAFPGRRARQLPGLPGFRAWKQEGSGEPRDQRVQ